MIRNLEILKKEINDLKIKGDIHKFKLLETKLEKLYGIEISGEEYQAREGLSRSAIQTLIESPWHYHKHYLSENRPKQEQTEAMKVGTAIHMALLEPHLFAQKYICCPKDLNRNAKEFKDWAKQYEGQNVELLKLAEYQDIIDSRDAILKDKVASKLIKNGICERSYFYDHPEFGRLKIRPDCLSELAMCDIKKTVCSSKNEFERKANGFKYYLQSAWYLWVYKLCTGFDLDFVFIAVEDKYPHNVNCYVYPQEDLNYAFNLIQKALEKYKECKEKNIWPKIAEGLIQEIKIPEYIKRSA